MTDGATVPVEACAGEAAAGDEFAAFEPPPLGPFNRAFDVEEALAGEVEPVAPVAPAGDATGRGIDAPLGCGLIAPA